MLNREFNANSKWQETCYESTISVLEPPPEDISFLDFDMLHTG